MLKANPIRWILLLVIVLVTLVTSESSQLIEIMCDVNGFAVPAVVDTGSEITVMSASCAKRCRIFNLIDPKHATRVSGLGTGEVIGGIEDHPMRIGPLRFGSKLSVLKHCRRDFIIGLDILDRFKGEIDLSKRQVKLNVRGNTVQIPLLNKLREIRSASAAEPQKSKPIAPSPIIVESLTGGFRDEEDHEQDQDDIEELDDVSLEAPCMTGI